MRRTIFIFYKAIFFSILFSNHLPGKDASVEITSVDLYFCNPMTTRAVALTTETAKTQFDWKISLGRTSLFIFNYRFNKSILNDPQYLNPPETVGTIYVLLEASSEGRRVASFCVSLGSEGVLVNGRPPKPGTIDGELLEFVRIITEPDNAHRYIKN